MPSLPPSHKEIPSSFLPPFLNITTPTNHVAPPVPQNPPSSSIFFDNSHPQHQLLPLTSFIHSYQLYHFLFSKRNRAVVTIPILSENEEQRERTVHPEIVSPTYLQQTDRQQECSSPVSSSSSSSSQPSPSSPPPKSPPPRPRPTP